ncbi:MAG TPA: dihydrolipoyl dehydrogenase [Terriglobia bacterium]|nr:dihydrolipoyl dehydrogenase [Terriglobia bacterium]
MTEWFDLVVIGGGPAGYAGAIRAAQLGKRVACVEMERAGGSCINWGCIPTKSLLRNAELYQLMRTRATDFGMVFTDLSYDWAKVLGRSQKVVAQLVGGIEALLKKNQVEYLHGEASLINEKTIVVTLGGETVKLLNTRHVLVATGVRPRELVGMTFNGSTIVDSRQALSLKKQPGTIVIIGGGAIGVEFAYFFNAYGTQVTLVEAMPQLVPLEDEEVSEALRISFTRQGIRILTNTRVESGNVTNQGIKLDLVGDTSDTLQAGVALVAAGVAPVLPPGLNCELDQGYIKVDDRYETSVKGICAAGDVIGPPWLAHVASFEAIQAVEGMFTEGKPRQIGVFPNCTYCQPQIASIGMTEKEVRNARLPYRVGRFPFRISGKALAHGTPEGFVKIIIGEPEGELLGAHIIGAEATEMVAELGVAMTLEATYAEIEATIHAHPTLSEAVHEASSAAFGEAIYV